MTTVKTGKSHKLQEMETKFSLNNLLNLVEKGDVEGWDREISRFKVFHIFELLTLNVIIYPDSQFH